MVAVDAAQLLRGYRQSFLERFRLLLLLFRGIWIWCGIISSVADI
jgi:hypothetical protein